MTLDLLSVGMPPLSSQTFVVIVIRSDEGLTVGVGNGTPLFVPNGSEVTLKPTETGFVVMVRQDADVL